MIAALGEMRHQGTHLALAGRGDARGTLEALARDVGAEDRVHFLGNIEDVRPLVRAATALVLPSKREGLARSVMEALALEVPVIASTARGNRELVGSDAGIVVETGDVGGFAEAMDWMIDHPDERPGMGAVGRARMVERYDTAVLFRLHEALYREMLAER